MAIDMCARISKGCMNEDALKRYLEDFFLPLNDIVMEKRESSVLYEHIYEDDKVIVFFVKEKRPPYNVYDSDICGGDFEYEQSIIFDINKEDATIDIFKKIIEFCIYLRERADGDILVTSDVHDEMCLLTEGTIIWSPNMSWTL